MCYTNIIVSGLRPLCTKTYGEDGASQKLTIDNNCCICVSLGWATCHMTFVKSSV